MTRRGNSIRPPQPIGHTLRQLASWAIAGTLGAASGCGSGFDGWAPVGCDDIDNVLRNPSFARDRDYFSILRDSNVQWMGNSEEPRSIQVQTLGKSGEPCKSASDLDACMRALEAATMVREACRANQHCGPFAVVTEGDQVKCCVIDFFERAGGCSAPSTN